MKRLLSAPSFTTARHTPWQTSAVAEPPADATEALTPLSPAQWREQRRAHHAVVDSWVTPHLQRRHSGQRHPVEDFLWNYYPYRPSALRLWNPGPAAVLLDHHDEEPLPLGFATDADGVATFAFERLPARHRERIATELPWLLRLLDGMRQRPAGFGCFGMHEWAMVLGQSSDEYRHSTWPMRVGPDAVRGAIADVGLRCTHFDAWRFFTPEATGLNPWPLSRAEQPERDQAGCLHANMDVYKWSMRMQPLVPSTLVTSAFDLAMRIRRLDMAASPYDFSALGVQPVAVETAAGRSDYARQQRGFSAEAAALRAELQHHLQPFAAAAGAGADTIRA